MRKRFWGLTAVAVVAVGGMFWMKCQGPGLPCMFTATAVVQHCRHLPAAVVGSASARGFRLSDGAAEASAGDEHLAAFHKPDDPVATADLKGPQPEHPFTAGGKVTPSPITDTIT